MGRSKLIRACVVFGLLVSPGGNEPGAARDASPADETPEADFADIASERAAVVSTSGSFVALTYNVAGLPEFLSRSRPSVYTPLIGKRLNRYDLVLLQESWQTPNPNPAAPLRCYHELLVATARHRYKSLPAPQPFGNDQRRPSALLSDGLNVFSKRPLAKTERVMWSQCVDTFNDCYALKGFSMTPLELAPGVSVHVYNLHMEAGWSNADDIARDEAIEQLLSFMEQRSKGEAVIVGGDFNLRGDRERTAVQLARLRDGGGLSDACVACARPRNVDKVLYRGSDRLNLKAESWRLESDAFTTDDGTPLSDHKPVAVRFNWSIEPSRLPPVTNDLSGRLGRAVR